jgi:TolB-like protein
MAKPADIFISYKAEDRPRVKPLVDALEADGFSVWWDAHIGGGVNWRRDIEEHLDAAKCVVVAWTKRSVGPDGEFVRDEARRARRGGTYLPVLFDAVEPPLGFGEVQALSLRGWKGSRSDSRYLSFKQGVQNRISGETAAQHRPHQAQISRRAVVGGGLGMAAIAVAGTGGWLLLKPAAADAKRIAVLPFANLSGDQEQAYFSDGIAEELRAALSRIGMEVIGRASSLAVKDLDSKEAAQKLEVANILTGSVRRSPGMIRISAQLISGKDGVERWAQSYDRAPGDAIKIQTDIAANVAEALSVALRQAAKAAIALGGTGDAVAQDLLLQARKVRLENNGSEAVRRAIQLSEMAIARDPNYADAFVEKAIGLNVLGTQFPASASDVVSLLGNATSIANRALAIAPKLGSAHAVLATIKAGLLEFASSLSHLKRALALSPDDPEVLTFATTTLPYLGAGQESLRLADHFIALDPLNARAYRRKAEVLYVLRRYPQSVEASRQASKLAPNSNRLWAVYSLLLMGKPQDARSEIAGMQKDDAFRFAAEGLVAARTGDLMGAARAMTEAKQQFGNVLSYQFAQIRAQMGQADRAFTDLDDALAAKDPGLIYLNTDPFLDPIRDDPRFAALIRKLNFP